MEINPETLLQTATIGRNVKGVPMSDEMWETFTHELRSLFDEVMFMVVGHSWTAKWGFEEVCQIGGVTTCNPEAVHNLAHFYGQEAVAFGLTGLVDTTKPTTGYLNEE